MQMNDYDVEETAEFLEQYGEDTPNLQEASKVLLRLMRWTNRNSDGWAYWAKPSKAAARLEGLLANVRHDYIRDELTDATPAELSAAYRPIKAFLTRQDVDHTEVFN